MNPVSTRTPFASPVLGRRLLAALSSALLLAVLSATNVPSRAHIAAIPAAAGGWLDRFNLWRASAGLSILTENPTWSAGDYNHSLYMVKNDLVTHYETAGTPYYTAEGDAAAQNGNIQVSSTTATTDETAIDWWMAAPFHAMGMMDPRLTQTGFGAYREVKTGWQAGWTLDTIRGNSFTGGTYPVYFPANGTSEPLTPFSGNETPDPLQACPGYVTPAGLPVFIEIGGNISTTAGPTHSFTGNGVALEHCVIDSTNAALSSYLKSRGGVIVVPRVPLVAGVNYAVSLTVNGTAYSWSFTVGPFVVSAPAGWQSIGGTMTSAPGVSSWGATRADVFVRAADNALYQNTWNGTAWSGWTTLGGVLTSSPGSVSWGANRVDVFVRGGDNALWQKAWDGQKWTAWQSLGGVLTSGPAAASCTSGHLDVFARGANSGLYRLGYTGTWGAWQTMGGQWASGPGAACQPSTTTVQVVEHALDSAVWQTTVTAT